MPLPPQTPLVQSFLQSMYDEGVINQYFGYVQALQDPENPEFLNEVMNLFYVDTDKVLEEMNGYLSQQNYEFGREFDFCIHQLYGSTATIGAQRLNVICEQLREAAEEKSRERVVEALNTFTREYCVFQNKFRTLQQLEKGNVYGNGFHSTETG